MKRASSLVWLVLFLFFAAFPTLARADAADKAIASRIVEVKGLKLHYLTAGHGPSVILLHGYAETSLMWRPIIPLLADRFTVVAPTCPALETPASLLKASI